MWSFLLSSNANEAEVKGEEVLHPSLPNEGKWSLFDNHNAALRKQEEVPNPSSPSRGMELEESASPSSAKTEESADPVNIRLFETRDEQDKQLGKEGVSKQVDEREIAEAGEDEVTPIKHEAQPIVPPTPQESTTTAQVSSDDKRMIHGSATTLSSPGTNENDKRLSSIFSIRANPEMGQLLTLPGCCYMMVDDGEEKQHSSETIPEQQEKSEELYEKEAIQTEKQDMSSSAALKENNAAPEEVEAIETEKKDDALQKSYKSVNFPYPPQKPEKIKRFSIWTSPGRSRPASPHSSSTTKKTKDSSKSMSNSIIWLSPGRSHTPTRARVSKKEKNTPSLTASNPKSSDISTQAHLCESESKILTDRQEQIVLKDSSNGGDQNVSQFNQISTAVEQFDGAANRNAVVNKKDLVLIEEEKKAQANGESGNQIEVSLAKTGPSNSFAFRTGGGSKGAWLPAYFVSLVLKRNSSPTSKGSIRREGKGKRSIRREGKGKRDQTYDDKAKLRTTEPPLRIDADGDADGRILLGDSLDHNPPPIENEDKLAQNAKTNTTRVVGTKRRRSLFQRRHKNMRAEPQPSTAPNNAAKKPSTGENKSIDTADTAAKEPSTEASKAIAEVDHISKATTASNSSNDEKEATNATEEFVNDHSKPSLGESKLNTGTGTSNSLSNSLENSINEVMASRSAGLLESIDMHDVILSEPAADNQADDKALSNSMNKKCPSDPTNISLDTSIMEGTKVDLGSQTVKDKRRASSLRSIGHNFARLMHRDQHGNSVKSEHSWRSNMKFGSTSRDDDALKVFDPVKHHPKDLDLLPFGPKQYKNENPTLAEELPASIDLIKNQPITPAVPGEGPDALPRTGFFWGFSCGKREPCGSHAVVHDDTMVEEKKSMEIKDQELLGS